MQTFAHEAVGFVVHVDCTVEGLLCAVPMCDAAVVEVVVLAPEAEVRIDSDEWHGRESQCILMDRGEELCGLRTACQGQDA